MRKKHQEKVYALGVVLGFEHHPKAGGLSTSACGSTLPVMLTGQTSPGNGSALMAGYKDQGPEQPPALVQPHSVLYL